MAPSAKHPGFAAEQQKLEGRGYSADSAGAILASAARKASPAAKEANPRLNRVSEPFHRAMRKAASKS